jgi:hypothetical protein
MTHLSEEQLVLFHYGESDEADAVRAHLQECASCRLEYQQLTRLLAAVDTAPVPERTESYGAAVWERVRPRLVTEARRRPVVVFMRRRWVAAVAVAASLILAFSLGRFLPRDTDEMAGSAPGGVRERVILVAVGDHLERSQMMLIDLVNAEARDSIDISVPQERAADLVTDNRLYRLAAERDGDYATVALLDELERLLLSISNADTDLPADEFESLRRRIEDGGILFRVRVVGANMRREIESARDSLRYTT